MAWYNSSWEKRKKITLTGGSSGVQTDYQVKITVTYDSDMDADFADLRFTASDGTSLLDYWVEDYTASTTAVVWVETDTPADTVEADIYMYYGNSVASSVSNGANTFLFFDDFSSSAAWTVGGGAVITGGVATLNGAGNYASVRATYVTPDNTASTARVKLDNTNCRDYFIPFSESTPSSGAVGGMHYDIPLGSSKDYRLRADTVDIISGGDGSGVTTGVWHIQELMKVGTSWTLKLDGVQEGATTHTYSDSHPYYSLYAFNSGSAGNVSVDYTHVRNYVTNPATYAFGDEQIEWYDSDFEKRKTITLTGATDGAQTDYQIKLTVVYDSDMKSDFSDLRFTKGDNTTLIDCWMEDHTASTSATIWVEFPTTPANGETEDYYMYYGNSGASDVWNMDNTFLFGDDFPGSSLDTSKWDTIIVGSGGVTVSSGIATITPSTADYDSTVINSKNTVGTNNIAIEGKVYYESTFSLTARYHTFGLANISSINQLSWRGVNGYYYISDSDRNGSIMELVNASTNSTSILSTTDWAPADTWFNLLFYYMSDGTVGKVENTNTAEEITDSTWLSQTKKVGLGTGHVIGYGGAMKIEYIFARKYITNPATYAFGDETVKWYSSDWTKRRPITLTGGSSGAQTDYQVKLTITFDSDMQVDFDDLRFVKSDNITVLDSWLESKTDSTSAVIWVETDTPANTINDIIYMYYGNSGAASDWDGDNTFLFYDDFPGTALDGGKWSSTTGSTVSSGELSVTANSGNGSHTTSTWNRDVAFRGKVKRVETGDGNMIGFVGGWGTDSCVFRRYTSNQIQVYSSSSQTTQSATASLSTYKTVDITWLTSEVKYIVDGVEEANSPITTNVPTSSVPIGFHGVLSRTMYSEWVLVRKYAANPAAYAVGDEETGGVSGTIPVFIRYYRNLRSN